ncbi:MAG: GTP-binding protein [Candidatus Heimdallarchaeota archaeon]|nr:GTP-binding protein [Candidatus Heimdallarchaeota archaeon]MBY8994791.1 GTP-binding protein [Candidatus Heimdallarchaeota archaeon]
MSLIEKISKLMTNQRKIRNIALVAHIDHGKTTLSDSLLVSAGVLAPSIAGEARALDFLPEEQRRGITMKTANISLLINKDDQEFLINLIDSPGHVDFSGKVARALRIVDGAIVVIDAVEQVMAQTETVIRQCVAEGVKPILFINKVDRLINELKLTPTQIAERIEIIYNNFNALVKKFSKNFNVPKWQSTTRDGSVVFGSALHCWAISIPIAKETKITFDQIVEFYSKNEIEALQQLLPIEKPLIDMIINHLPDPITAQKYRIQNIWKGDLTSAVGKAMINCQAEGEDVPLVFGSTKILMDKHAGLLVLGRIFSGVLKEKTNVILLNEKETKKIQNIYVFMGQDKKRLAQVPAGNTVAIAGLGEITPGETIVSITQKEMLPFEEIKYLATPVVTVAIEPEMLRDLQKLKRVLERFDLEDPNLLIKIDDQSGEILLMGLGELHLETVVNDISELVKCTSSSPLVIFVERLSKPSGEITRDEFGSKVKLLVESKTEDKTPVQSLETGDYSESLSQYQNEIIIKNSIITKFSKEAIENILVGTRNALFSGPISSKPVSGVRVIISDFEVTEGEKFEHTVPLLRNSVWDALRAGEITIQEPFYKIQITTPAMHLGKVTSIINKRKGNIVDVRSDQDLIIISGNLPVAESFNIDQDLRSDTEGRAFWQMSFERYEPISKTRLEEYKQRK